MLNLLPQEERRALRDNERMRFVAVAALFFAGVCVLSALMLAPSLMTLLFERAHVARELALLEDTSASDTEFDGALLLLKADTSSLKNVLEHSLPSELFALILAEKRQGVAITDMSYQETGEQLRISGIAQTREAFVGLTHALESSPRFVSVAFPVSGLAQNTDLPFSITLIRASTTRTITP